MSDNPPRRPRLVVGVGASAGGLDAFRRLLAVLPDDSGMAFLFVQHLDPSQQSYLADVLGRSTSLSVREAEQGAEIEADTIYTIRPATALAVDAGRLVESRPVLQQGVRMPVDHLFDSLAREYGTRAVGVVLSGAGNDGSAGVRSIKIRGGLAIAQDPDTCSQPGMPENAIATGAVDLVLEIAEIPTAIERFAALPARVRAVPIVEEGGPPAKLTNEDIDRLIGILGEKLTFDLHLYKPGTIERRILRRTGLCGFERVHAYLEHLPGDPDEQRNLVSDLLISVTDFFRDPEAYRALREVVVDPLVARAEPGAQLRVWVPGCASGEEAYSIAMEFLDAIAAHDSRASVHVFATDIDRDALAVARAATYSATIAERVSDSRLSRYFSPVEGRGYRATSPLRDSVSFAAHDLTRDPPFSRMHLVSCRNVLIYLTPDAQRRVLDILHFALEPGGHLFLSTSESTGAARDLFTTVSKTNRIYKKIGDSRPIALRRSRNQALEARSTQSREVERPRARRSIPDPARQAVIDALVPPTVVVSADGAVLFSHGELGPYLRIPVGEAPRLEIGSLLRPEIAIRSRGALYKCRQTRQPVVAHSSPDTTRRAIVRISARPASSLDGAVILSFDKVEADRDPLRAPGPEPATRDVVEQLEAELAATREDLRNAVEELESSNEELRAANEESMSINEELQSSNEELEASTEELRSLNEELTTANIQLREKIEELEQAHDDLDNFFASTKIATLFLDEALRIKRYTPAARELVGIDDADVGRAIDAIARDLLQHDLEIDARAVLEHLSPRTRELRSRDDRWVSRQVLPYRTGSRRIEGVVVTFVDVTELRAATERLTMREREQSLLARLGFQALRAVDLQSFMDQVVRDVNQTLEVDCCKILELQPGGGRLLLRAGVGWRAGLVGSAYVETGLDSQAGYTLQSAEPVIVDDLSTEKRFSGPDLLTSHQVTSGLSTVIRDGDQVYGVLGAHTRRARRFTADDAAFIQSVASLVGSAIGRYQTRTRLGLELGVASLLAEHDRPETAMPRVLEHLATGLVASIAELWRPAGNALSRTLVHVQRPEDRGRVVANLGDRLQLGDGLVGLVFERGRASWCTDLGDPSLFIRPDAARTLGLVSAVAFPIVSRNQAIGVITVFSANRLIADTVFLRSLETIGRAIGEYMVRSELEQRARRLAAITEAAQDAILSYNEHGVISEWLAGSEELFGFSAAEMIGTSIERIVPEDRREELWKTNARIRRGEVVDPYETLRFRKGGGLVEVSVRSAAIKDQEGRFTGISSTDRDITQIKETERQLLEASRQKDEFISMLSHELRNPLAAIRSATELLKLTVDDPRIAPTQAILERQTAHMAKLLDGLLDVSRIVRGKIQLEREVIDLAAVCRQVAADSIERLGERDLEIRTDVPSTPVRIEADRVRLAQIIDNLMSNAIRHTPDGGRITLRLTREGKKVCLAVRDTGGGIAPDLLPHIFEVFRQSKQNIDRPHGGLGLGLALVKSLAELHGGGVEARSDGPGKGAEFIVRFPATGKFPSPLEGAPEARGPLDILLVEDNLDAGEMLKQVLEISGHRVEVATRGQQGIEMALRNPPDVILCDLGLPDGVSGFDVARRLREAPETANTRLIALSGYGRSEDKARSSDAGFDAHLTKPVDVASLSRLLAEPSEPG